MKPWSHSSLKTFETCPRKYHAEKVEKSVPFTDTVHTIYGKQVHKAAEDYVRDGTPMPDDLKKFQPALDALVRIEGAKLCELEMGVTKDKQPTSFKDNSAWARGIADLVIINGAKAHVFDYKMGSAKYPDKNQLELMALMIFAHYPDVTQVKAALLFLTHNVVIKAQYRREQADDLWAKWETKSAMLQASFDNDHWPPKPNGLCRQWCGVKHCEYQGG